MRSLTIFALLPLFWQASCGNGQSSEMDHHKYTNALIHESSPYLLQHAHNPVNWFPWKEEALNKAREEDKLMVISVGYAACHWCHVMEHESFEDTVVAGLMNEHFVSIKVDREERPDVDDIYMNAAYLISGSGGWPLNAIALPDGRPVYAGTYYPKESWMEVLNFYIDAYQNDRASLEKHAQQLTDGIRGIDIIPKTETAETFASAELDSFNIALLKDFDWERGGQSRRIKFPMPSNYFELLRYHYYSGDDKALEAVNTTLTHMANGGIYDHLAGGFARYSTDPDWKVPHFEKMLYDNGQLVSLYSEAYQLTRNPRYKQVVFETLGWIERELTSPEGGFYSSLDADSEGEEGKFYVWTKDELDAILGDGAKLFNDHYSVKASGNWEHNNILYITKPIEETAQKHGLTVEETEYKLADMRNKVLDARAKRIRPGLDDKVLTAWNALMLKGYVDAYRAFGEQNFLDVAVKNAKFLEANALQSDGRLNRNYKDGQSSINAFLDDYALLAEAFISLYQATFDEQWLYKADELMKYTIAHFFNPGNGMFYFTSDEDPELIARKMELNDNVIPGSNSSMARVLYKLGLYFYNKDYLAKSKQMLSNMEEHIGRSPSHNSNWGILLGEFIHEPFEVAILGNEWKNVTSGLDQHYLPNVLLLGGSTEGTLELLEYKLVPDETRIYVCKDKMCRFPVNEVSEALDQIKNYEN